MKAVNNEIERICLYCERAVEIEDDDHVLCMRRGIVTKQHCCRRFVYDPLKRIPRRVPSIPGAERIDLDADE